MLTVTTTITRPSTSVPWFGETADGSTLTAMENDPLITGSTASNDTFSPLTKVFTKNFNSYDDYQSWITKAQEADPTVFTKRNDYVIANSMTLKVEESVDGGTAVIEKLI